MAAIFMVWLISYLVISGVMAVGISIWLILKWLEIIFH